MNVVDIAKRVWSVLTRYSGLVFFALGVFAAYLIGRRRSSVTLPPVKDIKAELAAVRAVGEAEKKIAEKGYLLAKQEIETAYVQKKAEFTAEEQRVADVLRNDPVALSRFLARAAARKP